MAQSLMATECHSGSAERRHLLYSILLQRLRWGGERWAKLYPWRKLLTNANTTDVTNTDCDSNGNSDFNSNGYCYCYAYGHSYSHSHAYAYAHADAETHTYTKV